MTVEADLGFGLIDHDQLPSATGADSRKHRDHLFVLFQSQDAYRLERGEERGGVDRGLLWKLERGGARPVLLLPCIHALGEEQSQEQEELAEAGP